MKFRRRNKEMKINYNANIAKLEELTEKLPQLKVNNRRFQRTIKEITTINKILDAFRLYSDYKAYKEVLKIVLNAVSSKYGIFGFIDSKGAFVCPSITEDIWDKCLMKDKDIVFPKETWGKSLWGRAIVEKKTLYSNKPFKVPEGHIVIRRALMVPIRYNSQVIGLFEVANKKIDYIKDDRVLLEQIARVVSPILMARLQRDGILKKGDE